MKKQKRVSKKVLMGDEETIVSNVQSRIFFLMSK